MLPDNFITSSVFNIFRPSGGHTNDPIAFLTCQQTIFRLFIKVDGFHDILRIV